MKKVVLLVVMAAFFFTLSGCAKKDRGYDIYVYNSKGENAAKFEAMCQAFTAETGIRVKAFSIGSGTDHMEALSTAMNSDNKPAVFPIQGIKELIDWYQGGFVVDLNTVADRDFAKLASGVPQAMRLTLDGKTSFGIPYNVEGYGYIVDRKLFGEIFNDVNAVLEAVRTASYAEWEALVQALDLWIKRPRVISVSLSGKVYTTSASKGLLSSNLNGVFAVMGAQRWTYGDHFINVAMNAVFTSPDDAYTASEEKIRSARPAFIDYARALDLKTSFLAGKNGPAVRGQDFVSPANFGYDQTVQIFADSKAVFFKQGNWVNGDIARVNKDLVERLVFLPVKMPYKSGDVVRTDGVNAEKLNRSIPVFVPNYYAVNAFSSDEEKADAYEFLVWMNTSPSGQKFLIDEFAFIPYNVDPAVTSVPNSLGNSIIGYMRTGDIMAAPYHGAPGPWSGDIVGLKLMEDYMKKPLWTQADYEAIADYAVDQWLKLK
ncbi:MAG: ABC transporter substrate-binding protein [Treponema sp.]|jgi:raffinose/stachyose/melibiose transport system substrate-binding protein|nr:ABC transporter substrate-binding protein [Treponema sp.]